MLADLKTFIGDNKNLLLDITQFILSACGLIPGVGEACDVADAGISLSRGDILGGILGGAAAWPIIGYIPAGLKTWKNSDKLRSVIDVFKKLGSGCSGGSCESVTRYGPLNKGPLPPTVANSFRTGTYNEMVSTKPTTVYRVYGGSAKELGSYWSRVKPSGPVQSIVDSALDPSWGNSATRWVSAELPPKTTFYEKPLLLKVVSWVGVIRFGFPT